MPFHSVNGMILLDGEINGKPAVLLLDTGADNSIVSPGAAGIKAKLDALKARIDYKAEFVEFVEFEK